ncbi:MAG: transposase [Candidatus Methanoperedens nitroreducens]|uniref:Transposase n=1 Tax=Candidatus Methanoperedens nitratireducens TaxID=1392998 RepID=A0A0N8KQA1_9EURY|nr:MAG: transposase [Candidatus Methanoperedens sp. BLZ1]CAG1002500.1 hypothetical protein METP2_03390 [Methanosarcinales archaeon]
MNHHLKQRRNSFGFYALNGKSVINFKEHSRKEDVCEFLTEIRAKNPIKNIILIFQKFSLKMSFAKGWIEKFLNNKLEMFGS